MKESALYRDFNIALAPKRVPIIDNTGSEEAVVCNNTTPNVEGYRWKSKLKLTSLSISRQNEKEMKISR